MPWRPWRVLLPRSCWRGSAQRHSRFGLVREVSCCLTMRRSRWRKQFRMLHALYPGRVDLGIGRAPGGGPVESLALRRERRVPMQDDFADQTAELLAYLNNDFPAGHPFAKLRVAPEMPGGPDVWMLGSSMWSSAAAAEFGLPYAFRSFLLSGAHALCDLVVPAAFCGEPVSSAAGGDGGGGGDLRRDG